MQPALGLSEHVVPEDQSALGPLGPAERRLMWVLASTTFVAMVGVSIIVPFLPLFAQSLGASGVVMGFIFSVFSLVRSITMPVVGPLSDRHGRKPFIWTGLLGYSATALLLLTVSSPLGLIMNRAFQGLFGAMVLPVSLALVADVIPKGREGRVMGFFNMALLLGFGLGPPLGGFVYDHLGLDANFYLQAGLSFLSLLAVLVWVREPPALKRSHRGRGLDFSLLADRDFLGIFLARFGAAAAMGCFMAFVPLLFQRYTLSNSAVGLFFGVNVLVMVAMQIPSGRLADRLPRVPLAFVGVFGSGVCKFLLPWAGGLPGLLVLSVSEGFFAGLALPALTALAVSRGRALGHGMGRVMADFTMAMSLGILVGPVLGGWLVDVSGVAASFWLAGGAAMAGSLGLVALTRSSSAPATPPPAAPEESA